MQQKYYDNMQQLYDEITPQSFESNDGRFSIKIIDDGMLELITTELRIDEEGYYDQKNHLDFVQTLMIESKDLDRLINILIRAKEINPLSLDSMKESENIVVFDDSNDKSDKNDLSDENNDEDDWLDTV